MKLNTFVRYNFLVDYYVPRIDTTNDVQVYVLGQEDLNVSIVSSRQQTTMFTKMGLEYGARLLNVRNPRGQQLFVTIVDNVPEQYPMHVHSNVPEVDVYGNIVGYRQVLREAQPSFEGIDLKEVESTQEVI